MRADNRQTTELGRMRSECGLWIRRAPPAGDRPHHSGWHYFHRVIAHRLPGQRLFYSFSLNGHRVIYACPSSVRSSPGSPERVPLNTLPLHNHGNRPAIRSATASEEAGILRFMRYGRPRDFARWIHRATVREKSRVHARLRNSLLIPEKSPRQPEDQLRNEDADEQPDPLQTDEGNHPSIDHTHGHFRRRDASQVEQ